MLTYGLRQKNSTRIRDAQWSIVISIYDYFPLIVFINHSISLSKNVEHIISQILPRILTMEHTKQTEYFFF